MGVILAESDYMLDMQFKRAGSLLSLFRDLRPRQWSGVSGNSCGTQPGAARHEKEHPEADRISSSCLMENISRLAVHSALHKEKS
jgi:hypothetical protein